MKKKYSLCFILLITISVLFTGCKGNSLSDNTDSQGKKTEELNSQIDTEQEKILEREVIFLQNLLWQANDATEIHEQEMNFGYEELDDKNVLYAYAVDAHYVPDEIKDMRPVEGGNENYEVELEQYRQNLTNRKKSVLRISSGAS